MQELWSYINRARGHRRKVSFLIQALAKSPLLRNDNTSRKWHALGELSQAQQRFLLENVLHSVRQTCKTTEANLTFKNVNI